MSYLKQALSYIDKTYKKEDDFLCNIKEKAAICDFPIQISIVDGLMLEFLIKVTGVKNMVEVGTLAGFSTVWCARALPKDGKIHTIERSETRFELASSTFSKFQELEPENACKIESYNADAVEKLYEISDKGPFDLIFIDADKISYLKYLKWAEENIIKKGFIVADNTFLFGSVFDYKVNKKVSPTTLNNIKAFNDSLADSNRYNSFTTIGGGDGFTVAQKLF